MERVWLDMLDRLIVGSVALTERAIAAAGADLTFVQWRVVLIVGDGQDGATIGEIAARIGAEVSPASRLISRLRRRGVVTTEKDELDKRVTRVRLTTVGRGLRSRVSEYRRHVLADLPPIASTPAGADAIADLARAFESFA